MPYKPSPVYLCRMPCGCACTGMQHPSDAPPAIQYCPTHEAAPALKSALEAIHAGDNMADLDDLGIPYTLGDIIQRHYKIARLALARVKP